jgi:hypothetical protein
MADLNGETKLGQQASMVSNSLLVLVLFVSSMGYVCNEHCGRLLEDFK